MREDRDAFTDLTDSELQAWVVDGRARWQDAYHTLVHVRYGATVESAIAWACRRHGVPLTWEEVIERLFINLRGRDGTWTGLESWSEAKGAFSGWIWIVTRNLCFRMMRTRARNPLQNAASLTPPEDGLPSGPAATLADDNPLPESTVAVDLLLEEISPECAHLLRSKYYLGMTDTEIAQEIGVGREWANRQRRRCEKNLASLFQREGLSLSDFDF